MKYIKLIVFAGLPLSGKTTLAERLSKLLKISSIDVNKVRQMLFKYNSVSDQEAERALDEAQMKASWLSLYALAENILEAGDSVIVSGTFSRPIQHQQIKTAAERRKAELKVIFCQVPDQVIEERVKSRKDRYNLKSMASYQRVKERYVKIEMPVSDILDLDTSRPVEECLSKIIAFLH